MQDSSAAATPVSASVPQGFPDIGTGGQYSGPSLVGSAATPATPFEQERVAVLQARITELTSETK
jgi:hypothetical protein